MVTVKARAGESMNDFLARFEKKAKKEAKKHPTKAKAAKKSLIKKISAKELRAPATTFLERYCQFISELETISELHDEQTDTDVRERMYMVINYYFVWDKRVDAKFPKLYAMFTRSADKLVYKAVLSFVESSKKLARAERIAPGKARHKALANPKAVGADGNEYSLFLGFAEDVLPDERPSADEYFK